MSAENYPVMNDMAAQVNTPHNENQNKLHYKRTKSQAFHYLEDI
jgi:hypothetical protein